jgi:peroxiredoxin
MQAPDTRIALNIPAPHFTLPDHGRTARSLGSIIGQRGVVLGFTGDIWRPASIRRIIWLQRHATLLQRTGFNVALLIRDEPHMVYGFYASSPNPPVFPMLADTDGDVHRLFGMTESTGMVILDQALIMRQRWLLGPDRIWPRLSEIMDALDLIDEQAPN